MTPIISSINNEIATILKKLYDIEGAHFKIEHPANESFGDYACNVGLLLSKQLKQPPMIIANAVSYELQEMNSIKSEIPMFSVIEAVAPGFINIKISDIWLKKLLTDVISANNTYGSANVGTDTRVALEHSNVNPNKAAHIGHLRNACIGQFLEKIYEALGYQVDVQYYANNIGVQVATSHMGIKYIKNISPESYNRTLQLRV